MKKTHSILVLGIALCGHSCSAPDLLEHLEAGLRDAPRGKCHVEVEDGQVVRVAVPIDQQRVPTAAERAAAAVQPAGQPLQLLQEWGPHGHGFRWTSRIDIKGHVYYRSLLVDAQGTVLERRHEVMLADAPAKVLQHAVSLGGDRSAVQRIDQVLTAPDAPATFHALVRRENADLVLVCDAYGRPLRQIRTMPAHLQVGGELSLPKQ